MATPETLTEIRDHLERLPERLAVLLGRPNRDASGRFTSASGGSGGTKEGIPTAWDATERLSGALGRFVPAFGAIGNLMKGVRELDDAWKQFKKAVGPREEVQPTKIPLVPQTQASNANKSVPQPTQIGQGGQGLGSFSGTSMQDFGANLKANTEMMRRLMEVMRQQEPDQADESERTEPEEPLGEGWKDYKPAFAPARANEVPRLPHTPHGPMRPEKHVPSSKESEAANKEAMGAALKLFI